LDQRTEAAARQVVDAAIKVHRTLGPGLLESVYEHCLAHELATRGVPCRRQAALPIIYGRRRTRRRVAPGLAGRRPRDRRDQGGGGPSSDP
jgi:GxxExxY protein